jgi:hypothetical protein
MTEAMSTNVPRPHNSGMLATGHDYIRANRYERYFFSGMAVLILGTVVLGFAKTYFLAGLFRAPLPEILSGIRH